MGLKTGVVRAAVVQLAPVIMDTEATLEKIARMTKEAADGGRRSSSSPRRPSPATPGE